VANTPDRKLKDRDTAISVSLASGGVVVEFPSPLLMALPVVKEELIAVVVVAETEAL